MDFVQHILNGLLQGCILALIGLGFSLVWASLNIVNLHHAPFIIGPLYVPYAQIGAVVVALLLTYLLYLFLDHTRTGSSIRAVGQDRVAARLMGIDIARTYALTFGIGAALAAASGALLSTTSGFAPNGFSTFNVLAFSVVVLGGLGSIPGALLGGLVFGLVYEFGGTYVLSQRDVVIFAILIVVLVLM